MKKIIFAMMFIASGLVSAQESIAEAVKGTQYGAGVPEEMTFDVYDTSRLIKELKSKEELDNIIIQAKATAVCQKKGCWITLQNPENEQIFVKMKDYEFFLPQSIVGKTILLHGKANYKVTPVEELQHYAKDAGKSKEEIAKITQAKTEIRVLANGIKVID